jgi:8-oxo-dGTP pyrophosphatase MutT (NUDIX family)
MPALNLLHPNALPAVQADPAKTPLSNGARQVAALPFRFGDGVEVMLISSRRTRRWVLPKGWPKKGLDGPGTAEREAFEEAGLIGEMLRISVGTYAYDKHMPKGAPVRCEVQVFPLKVERQRKKWPERHERLTAWFPVRAAADLVDEPELRDLLLAFAEAF